MTELLILTVVLGVIGIAIFTISGGFNLHRDAFDAEVIRKYEFHTGECTIYRVDVRRRNVEFVETLDNTDTMYLRKFNSATIHANLKENHWYSFNTCGRRNEYWSWFPNLMTVSKLPNGELN